ncbi:zf-C3HC-domain-containing protein [Crassisporium funariophilum]|nr:zf-C3HC-domain-containing protein [Crassisporium funariophilum]
MAMAETSTPSASHSSNTENNLRLTKRKLEDAFHTLDDAFSPTSNNLTDRPHPPKRSNTIRSLYSTLAKYGIKSRETQPTTTNHTNVANSPKSTPHLTAILNRAASKTKNTFSFKFNAQSHTPAPPLPATAEYRPSSLSSFLSRLATYKLATYANKPASIDAVAASKCGWINDGQDRLVCGLCNASWVAAGRDGLNRDAANALIEKQRASLVDAHKQGCPWRTRQCDASIYCIPLQSPMAMIRDITANAATLDPLLKDVPIKHPLTQSQLKAFRSAVASYTPTVPESSTSMDVEPMDNPLKPAENATLVSLFGWTLVTNAPEPFRRASTARANSVASSAPPTPLRSRASSVSLPHTPPSSQQQTTAFTFRVPSKVLTKPASALLRCKLCQRRIGLWAFTSGVASEPLEETLISLSPSGRDKPNPISTTRPKKPLPQRSFDILKEHRSYCPYAVRSTIVPSLPVPLVSGAPSKQIQPAGHLSNSSLSHLNGKGSTPGALEGWRAVLTVVLRHGMAQRQRIEYNFLELMDSTAEDTEESNGMEVDNVKAMVAGVKSRGGKDLLKYVRGLLG